MTGNTEDRRARRSKRMLKEGLSELLREKKFNKISVKDITERMDINRGTFYLHYPDTRALLESLEGDMLDDAQKMIDEYLPKVDGRTLQPVFEPVLDYIVEHRDICLALFRDNSGAAFVERLYDLIYRNCAGAIRSKYHAASDEQLSYLLSFVTYGLIGLIKSWFDDSMKLPKSEVVAMADGLVEGSCERLLGEQDAGASGAAGTKKK